MKSFCVLVLLFSSYFFLFIDAQTTRERHHEAINGVLNGTFTISPYNYLFPLDAITTSLVLVSMFGIIGLLTVLVYWPLPTPKVFTGTD